MIFYILFFLIICITSIQYYFRFVINDFRESKINLKYQPWLVTLVLMTVILGLRYRVGTDYMNYIHIFELYKSGAKPIGVEIGYELLNKIILFFGLNFWGVFFISSAITNYFVLKTFHEKSYNFFLSVYILFGIGFIFFQTNGIRQALAISLIFYGTKYLIDKNFKKYLLFCLLASLFHISALIMIPVYWFSRIKLKKFIVILILLIGLIFFVFPSNLEYILSNILHYLTPTFYRNYLTEIFSNKGAINTGLFVIGEAFLSIIIYIVLPSNKKLTNQGKVYYNLYLFSILSKLLLGRFNVLNRFINYFTIYHTLFVPYFFSKIKSVKLTKFILFTSILIYYGMQMILGLKVNVHDIIPYQNLFF